MPNFRQAPNGYVSDELSDAELTGAFRNLNLLRKDAANDFSLLIDGSMAIEALHEAGRLIGPSFRRFMEANYDSGRGRLAGLVKDIAHYLNGRIGHHSLLTSIRVEELKLQNNANRVRTATYSPTHVASSALPLLEDGYVVHDKDLYRLAAGISPANVVRIVMLLGGDSYYV